MTDEQRATLDEFRSEVNMTASELEGWLDTDESRAVGAKDREGAESVGHASGRRIVTLLRTRQDDYSDDDFAHMRKVIGYIRRHTAQRPDGDVQDTPWRHSLMNWGHDPQETSRG